MEGSGDQERKEHEAAVEAQETRGVWAAARVRAASELPAIAIGLVAVVLALVVFYDLLGVHPRVPVSYTGDANLTMTAVRNIKLHGWFVSTPQLGAPYGQDLHDYPPVGDGLHLVAIWFLALMSRSPGFALNVFFFGSYLTVFLGAYIAARMLFLTRTSSVMVAILYAFLPFHFQQGPGHLLLSSYFAVPLWIALFVRQLGDEPFVAPVPAATSPRAWWEWLRRPPVLGAVVVTLLAVTTGLYYAIFFCLIGGFVSLLLPAMGRSIRRAATLLVFVGFGGVVLVAQYLPVVAFQREHGSNLAIVDRGIFEVEYYSLKLSDMLLPVRGHRLHEFARLQAEAQQVPLIGERTEALGLIGVLGLVLLFGTVIGRALGGRPAGRAGAIAAVAGLAFVLGTTGGLSQVLGVFGLTEIRAWSRISVVIAFCALVGAGMAFDLLRARFALHWFAAVAIAALVIVLGLLDMTPNDVLPSYDATARQWGSDRDFVHGVEAVLGADAAVFQLPIVPFPENPPVNAMTDYDHVRGYLHSDTLSWSYGGVKGRTDAWQQRLAKQTAAEQADAIAEAGFDGVWLDRYGYGPELAQVEADLTAAFGPPVLTDPRGRVALFDARPRRARLTDQLGADEVERLGAIVTDPTSIRFGSDFWGPEQSPEGEFEWAKGDSGTLHVRSFGADGAKVRVRFAAGSATEGKYDLEISAPDVSQGAQITTEGTVVEFVVSVPEAGVDVHLRTNAPRLDSDTESRDLRFRVAEPTAERVEPERQRLP